MIYNTLFNIFIYIYGQREHFTCNNIGPKIYRLTNRGVKMHIKNAFGRAFCSGLHGLNLYTLGAMCTLSRCIYRIQCLHRMHGYTVCSANIVYNAHSGHCTQCSHCKVYTHTGHAVYILLKMFTIHTVCT